MRLDSPSIDASHEAPDGAGGDAGKFREMLKPACRGFRGAVVHEQMFHIFAERRMLHDAHTLVLRIFPSHICFVVGGAGVIPSPHRVAAEFFGERGNRPAEHLRDRTERISLAPQNAKLAPFRSRKMAAVFLSCSHDISKVFGFKWQSSLTRN